MPKKKVEISDEVKALVDLTARATADAYAENIAAGINYYGTMERLLTNYKKICKIVADEALYTAVECKQHSKDIVTGAIRSGGGTGIVTDEERMDEMREERERSYSETRACLDKIERVIAEFVHDKEFIVIRMYYFGEDAAGNPREGRQTFTDIAVELERDEKTVRRWRNRIVNDMAICMFGIDAAINASKYRATPAICKSGA